MIMMAAVKHSGRVFAIPAPARHSDIIRRIDNIYHPEHPIGIEDGFVTDKGQFVDRKEAWWLAAISGQVPRLEPRELFTEDLW